MTEATLLRAEECPAGRVRRAWQAAACWLLSKAERQYLASYGWHADGECWRRPHWHPKFRDQSQCTQSHSVNSQKKYDGDRYRSVKAVGYWAPEPSWIAQRYAINSIFLYGLGLAGVLAVNRWWAAADDRWWGYLVYGGLSLGPLAFTWLLRIRSMRELLLEEAEHKLAGERTRRSYWSPRSRGNKS